MQKSMKLLAEGGTSRQRWKGYVTVLGRVSVDLVWPRGCRCCCRWLPQQWPNSHLSTRRNKSLHGWHRLT